jgi:CheY-specific phosphatase CheX
MSSTLEILSCNSFKKILKRKKKTKERKGVTCVVGIEGKPKSTLSCTLWHFIKQFQYK